MKPLIWVHADSLRAASPAFEAHLGAPAVFVFDDEWIESEGITLKRLVFQYECLMEMPVVIRRGRVTEEVLAFARQQGVSSIVTTDTACPRFLAQLEELRRSIPVEVLPEPMFVDHDGPLPLKRFSQFWNKVGPVLLS